MTYAKRGGLTLKTGKIGHMNVLRQQMLMPGETMDIKLSGSVRLESLRERDVMRINAKLLTFMQPLRWCETASSFTDYVKEGPDTAISLDYQSSSSTNPLSLMGIGTDYVTAKNYRGCFYQSMKNIYDQWIRWPEDSPMGALSGDGPVAVPLEAVWSRARFDATPDDSDDYTQSSATNFDVRELAKTQARFRSAMKRDVFSYGRWQEICKEMWDAQGSREVDRVPVLVDSTEVGVNPREMPATDGASLGQWQSLYDFNVNHSIGGVVAPEHMILTYVLIVRFAPITESVMPLATEHPDWYVNVADPEYISSNEPQALQIRECIPNTSTTQLGYLPAGWQWRCEHNVIGTRVDALDSFPYSEAPTTQANAKDASRIKNAFRSDRLGDYVVDIYFTEDSNQPIGTAMDSYYSGMVDQAKGKNQSSSEHPKQGKMV